MSENRFILFLLLLLAGALTACDGNPEASGSQVQETAEPAAPITRDPLQGTVLVPAGPFLFGATDKQIEFYVSQSVVNFPGMVEAIRSSFATPQRSLELEGFHIQQFEVTNHDFKEFIDATGYQPKNTTDYLKIWQGGAYPDWAETFPVVWVSQRDATAFCQWRGGWLPSEQEWEKAARGVDGRYFPWGNVFPSRELANFASKQAEPAGNRPGDVSPFEAYDMGGNVAELTKTVVPDGGSGQVVVRGGSYVNQAREMMTVHRDLSTDPDTRRSDLGFRCAAR